MRKETLVASIDGDTTIKRERRNPGPRPKERATCAYEGCTRPVKLNAKYCSISHSKLGKTRTASNTIATPTPKPKKTFGLVTILDDQPSSLIASIEE